MYDEDPEVLRVAREIDGYLTEHPKAADTLDGIVKWWLSRTPVEEAKDLVAKALEHLKRQAIVTKTVSGDGKEIYSRLKAVSSSQRKG